MSSEIIHIVGYLVLAVPLSLLLSGVIALVTTRLSPASKVEAGTGVRQGVAAHTALGFGSWFGLMLAFLALLLAPGATGTRLYAVCALAAAAAAVWAVWKPLIRSMLFRLIDVPGSTTAVREASK